MTSLVSLVHMVVGKICVIVALILLGDLQIAAVQYVLDSVVAALEQDPNRKFIYVEQVFIAESCSGSFLH